MNTQETHEEDFDIVAVWLRKDPIRWIAGAAAGVFAAVVALSFAMLLSKVGGMELWFPIKMAAIPVMGAKAMEFGAHPLVLIVGLLTASMVSALLGFVYAHFTGTNEMPTLLGSGFVWGTFAWIFILNLFVQSIPEINWLGLPKGPGFFILQVWGLSLPSVAFFDRSIRGSELKG